MQSNSHGLATSILSEVVSPLKTDLVTSQECHMADIKQPAANQNGGNLNNSLFPGTLYIPNSNPSTTGTNVRPLPANNNEKP